MPRKQSARKQQEWESGKTFRSAQSYGMDAEFSGWVNCPFSADHRAAYTKWVMTPEAATDLQEVVNAHYRISLGEDLRSGGYVANAFMRQASHVHAGRMTSQRSGDAVTALFKLVYVIQHIMPGDWNELSEDNDDAW